MVILRVLWRGRRYWGLGEYFPQLYRFKRPEHITACLLRSPLQFILKPFKSKLCGQHDQCKCRPLPANARRIKTLRSLRIYHGILGDLSLEHAAINMECENPSPPPRVEHRIIVYAQDMHIPSSTAPKGSWIWYLWASHANKRELDAR